jgi:hypothetical protein
MGGLFYRDCLPSSLSEKKIKSLSLEDAELFISQGKYVEAMDIYRRLISTEPSNVYLLQRVEELKTFLKLLKKEKTT